MRVFACLAPILIGSLAAASFPVVSRALAPADGAPGSHQFAAAVQEGVDLYGNDIGMVEVAPGDVAACSARCDADGRCQAFTLYTPPPGDKGFCWLKHAVGERRAGPYVVSGLRRSTPTRQAAAPVAPASSPGAGLCYAANHYFVARIELELRAGIAAEEARPLLDRLKAERDAWAGPTPPSEQAAMDLLGDRSDAEVADLVNVCAEEPVLSLSN